MVLFGVQSCPAAAAYRASLHQAAYTFKLGEDDGSVGYRVASTLFNWSIRREQAARGVSVQQEEKAQCNS